MTLLQSSVDCSTTVVAIDLGSNSFHLLVAASDASGSMVATTILARKVQLALDMVDHQLSVTAIERGLECLKEFAEYTRGLQDSRVKIIGTQALRQAINRDDFIIPASQILGHSIDVVSGVEEAILAYHGAATTWCSLTEDKFQRFVVDIGGGSTELVIGGERRVISAISVPVGCVSGLQYFPEGTINDANIEAAQQAAIAQFTGVAKQLDSQWQLAVGCSGTLLAVEQVLIQQGWTSQGITLKGLKKLRRALLDFDRIENISFQGLHEDRRSIFATGVAIVLALFDVFNIEIMHLSNAGLREGIAWQLLQDQ